MSRANNKGHTNPSPTILSSDTRSEVRMGHLGDRGICARFIKRGVMLENIDTWKQYNRLDSRNFYYVFLTTLREFAHDRAF